jgi:hypothetical protein
MAFQFVPMFAPVKSTLMADLTALSLTTNLKLVLDAGDASSYTSGQKWLDRSGGGYDFFLGADGSATASDPTYNGTAGGQSGSEYWSFDGGDYFTYDSVNETWMDALHKDNAVFSFAVWTYVKDPGVDAAGLFRTARPALDTGIAVYYAGSANTRMLMTVTNGGANVFSLAPTVDLNKDAWNFISGSINETGNASLLNINGTGVSGTATYSSPAAGGATATLSVASQSALSGLPSGARLASVALWQGTALSAGNLTSIYVTTRGKFGF